MNIRKATEQDKPKLAELIEKDPFHKEDAKKYSERTGKPPEDFFFEAGSECLAIENRGTTMYFRLSRALRIHAVLDTDTKSANAKTLLKFMPWLEASARNSGYREMVFSTESEEVAEFEKRTMGFEPISDLVLNLPEGGK